ncbi:MAG: ribonuclease R [Bacteroidota bacterium]
MAAKKINGKSKLGKNPFYNQVMNVFVKSPYGGFNFRQVSKQMGINDKASRELVRLILEELCMTKEIVEDKRGKYKLNPGLIREKFLHNTITGRVDMKDTGKAYIISDDDTEDIYIAANNTNRALNGDTVKVMLFPKRSGRKPEGQILEVLERAHKNFVGVMKISGAFGFLIPDDVRMPVDIFIPGPGLKGAKDGEKVLAVMTDWPEHSKNPFGEVLEVLGKPGEHAVEMNSILANYDFPLSFSKAAEKEAENITEAISREEYAKRRDFRDIFTCTIDPIDAKDFDDALSLKKLPNGNWEVGVHIADVSHFVRPGMAIDKEAYDRATSVYLVDRTFPMLPEKLSNKVCSLRADEEKLCFSTVFEMNDKAEVISEWFGKTVILSDRRFTYEEVQEMLDGNEGDFKAEILILDGLAKKLRADRFKKGSINFRSREVKFRLDEFSRPVEAFIKEQNDSHRLIEDFMLLSNKKVAEKIGKKKGEAEAKSFVYRIHDEPNPEKLGTFVEFVAKLGYSVKTGSRKTLSDSLNQLFDKIAGKGEENLVETIAIRTMSKAIYSTKNIGHYGLAFPFYTHFTSPIRRYPDLMVHRLLEEYMAGKKSVDRDDLEAKCKHSSEMERNAADAERASVKFKQAEFMLDKIGQDFSGLISGVGKWGFWVELDINKGEGMVPMRSLQDDYYSLDEDNFMIVGERRGKKFRLGDPVMIKVKHIDLARKQMDFELVE